MREAEKSLTKVEADLRNQRHQLFLLSNYTQAGQRPLTSVYTCRDRSLKTFYIY